MRYRARERKKYSNSLKRYRQSIIHVLQFHTNATAHIVIHLPVDINRNVTLFIATLSTIWDDDLFGLWLWESGSPLSVLQHRTRYQTSIQINAISLKRLHVVNKIGGF